MRSARNALLLILAITLLASDTAFTRGYVYSNIGTLFTWSGSAQSWSESTQAVSCNDWTSYIRNDGTACTSGTLIGKTWALAHAVVTVVHSPLLTNPTFNGGGFGSWSSANTGGCTGLLFTGQNSADQDGDAGRAQASSGTCSATPAQVTLAQTFSISGTPTSQTYSFWYMAPLTQYGDPVNCTQGTGTASLSLKVNGTTTSLGSVTTDGAWHHLSGTTSALVNGSNTVTVTATIAAALGQTSHYSRADGIYICYGSAAVAQSVNLDDFSLSAVW